MPVILDTVESIMPRTPQCFGERNMTPKICGFLACDDSVQYLIHDFADMLTSKVCHNFKMHFNNFRRERSGMCVVCTV